MFHVIDDKPEGVAVAVALSQINKLQELIKRNQMKSNLLSVKKQTNSIYWLRKYCQFQSDGFSRPGFQLLIYKRTKVLFEIFRTTRGKSDIFYNVCYFKRGGFAHENFENIISR